MQSDKLSNKRLRFSQLYDITLKPTGAVIIVVKRRLSVSVLYHGGVLSISLYFRQKPVEQTTKKTQTQELVLCTAFLCLAIGLCCFCTLCHCACCLN